jgi:RNA polymerase sigma factor (sigma-70 family)
MSAVDTPMPVRRLVPGHPIGCPTRRTSGAAWERRLFRRYRATGDPAVREALVERFLPLARRIALRYNGNSEPLEDLYQVACVALVLAIDRYDPGRDAAFSSFAVPTIAGELKRHLRDRTWAVHVPRGLRELAVAVRRAQQEIAGDLGRPATIGELAAAASASPTAVRDALHAPEARVPGSLDGTCVAARPRRRHPWRAARHRGGGLPPRRGPRAPRQAPRGAARPPAHSAPAAVRGRPDPA